MDIQHIYQAYQGCTAVSNDTRKLPHGAMYVALKGPNFDGNQFIKQALKAGARYCLSDDPAQQGPSVINVNNTLTTLQELATHHRRQWSIPVIGLTGSNGKTTSKELLHAVLSQKYRVGYTHGNLNNHIGVPLTILNLSANSEIAIVEMGANHQGEIAQLSAIAQPDYGFITNYGKAHLEGFGGIEGIIKGKSELYDYLRSHQKTAWINCSDALQREKSEGIAARYFFGNCKNADFPVHEAEISESGTVNISINNSTIKSKLTGSYNFSNLAVAAAAGKYFEVPLPLIKKGLENYSPHNNRSQLEQLDTNLVIKDYYNANPDSMEGAIRNLLELKRKAKWVILGDMFELGESSAKEHQKITDSLAHPEIESVILIGQAFAETSGVGKRFLTTPEAVAYVQEQAPQHKTILIKGSRGMQLEKIATALEKL